MKPTPERRAATCDWCGLPARPRRVRAALERGGSEGSARESGHGALFCCTGCALVAELGSGEAARSDQLLARVLLGAFLSTGVMVVSIALYGGYLDGGEAARSSAAAEALTGLYRLAALALSLPIAALLGWPLARAVTRAGRWLSFDVWILIGAASALLLSIWKTLVAQGPVYYESASMILVLVGLGRWIDVRAKERARERLLGVLPEAATDARRILSTTEESVAPSELRAGDLVRVRPGEPVPADGAVCDGRAFVDTADLTGESTPRSVAPGDRVLAGFGVLDGALVVRVEQAAGQGQRDRIERLLERAMVGRGAYQRRAERLAAWMIPAVLAVAAAVFAAQLVGGEPARGVARALSVLLVACPCALGIATPIAFWYALARAWERRVLVKGSEVLERMARVKRVFFDKTGTLTRGELELVSIHPQAGTTSADALRLAAACELGSEHPVGRGLRRAFKERNPDATLPRAESFRRLPGSGVEAWVEGRAVRVTRPERSELAARSASTCVQLSADGEPRALFQLADRARPEAPATVRALREQGLELRVLSGDGRGPVQALAEELGVPAEAELLPGDKVRRLEHFGTRDTLFAGDGLNDAAALASASVGVAVDGGSPRSFEAADALLLGGSLAALPRAIDLARVAVVTARVNLAWCVVYNVVGIWLAASGRLTPVLAGAAMVLSGAGVLANTSRAFAKFGNSASGERGEAASGRGSQECVEGEGRLRTRPNGEMPRAGLGYGVEGRLAAAVAVPPAASHPSGDRTAARSEEIR